jgi:predicted Rossmann fold flavoprotein
VKKDVIIIGAGASGLMCAIEAGKRVRSVLVTDHAEKIGKKIRVSGGGRCNFTNTNIGSSNYLSNNPHFCKSALARFTPDDFIRLIKKHGIRYYEKEEGQLFCRESSGEIITMLQRECDKAGVEIRLHGKVEEVMKKDMFTLQTNQGTFESGSLVVATGGISYPQMGATDRGHRIAKQFGIKVTSLTTGFVVSSAERWTQICTDMLEVGGLRSEFLPPASALNPLTHILSAFICVHLRPIAEFGLRFYLKR